MNVLTKNVPILDYDDPKGSLEKVYTYLFDIMEQIDYTLSRQGIQLGKVSLPATAKQIEQLEGRVSGLSSNIAVLAGLVNVTNEKATLAGNAAEQAIQTAESAGTKAQQAQTLAGQLQESIAELAARVAALEQKGES